MATLTADQLTLIDNSIKKVLGKNNSNLNAVKNYIITKVTDGVIDIKDIQQRLGSVVREAISNTMPIDASEAIGVKVIDGVTYQGDGKGRYVEVNNGSGSGSGGSSSSTGVTSVNGKQGDVIVTKQDLGIQVLDQADKKLASMNVVNMMYDAEGNVSKIRYNDDTDINYETYTYNSDGDLSLIKHYLDGAQKGTTTLTYASGNLVSSIFVGV